MALGCRTVDFCQRGGSEAGFGRVGGASCILTCSPLGSRGEQFLTIRKIVSHPLCRVDATLQPALISDVGNSVPDGDGGFPEK